MEFIKQFLLTFILVTAVYTEDIKFIENVDFLTRHFFANLQEDPKLKDENFTETSKLFIDKLVANYLDLMKYTLGVSKHMVTRRSLPVDDLSTLTTDNTGVHRLSGFKKLYNVKAKYPRDLVMFYLEYDDYKQWYAAALEGEKQQPASKMVIYKLRKMEFDKIQEMAVQNGTKLAVHSVEQAVFIAIAENSSRKHSDLVETGIFKFSKNEELQKIQSINMQFASDVKIWQDDQNLFLFFGQYMSNISNKVGYEVNVPIYKWRGKHFDIIQEITTYSAKSIEAFTIGKFNFLVITNYQNNYGQSNIYSEIFKYDLDTDRFKLHQKILTNAAVNVRHFYFTANNIQEHFLVFANFFEKGMENLPNYETNSIIYKYVEGYFMPFESFKLNAATEWLPIMGPNNSCILLVACKFEGIKAFEYNGWKFMESPIQYTTGTFAKGVTAMHSYEFNNKTVLVIANENDQGLATNIFEVSFTLQNDLSRYQDNMLQWCKHKSEIVEHMAYPELMKQEGKDEPVLQLPENQTSRGTAEKPKNIEIDDSAGALKEDIDELKKKVQNQINHLNAIENQVKSSFQKNATNIIKGDLYVNTLILNNNTGYFDSLNATTINSINITDFLNNVINTTESHHINNIQIEDVQIENKILPKFINSQLLSALVNKNLDNHLVNLTVNGTVTLINNLNVGGAINGIDFSIKNILLKRGNQSLTNLNVDSISIDQLDMNQTLSNSTFLSVRKAQVSGLVNNVDINTVNDFALRKRGPQIITGEFFFDILHTDHLIAKKIAEKNILDDLILIDKGDYEIVHPVEFVNNLTAKNIQISQELNGIPAVDGKLEVLLSNVPHTQHIKGVKTFENVQLKSPINLQGKINSPLLDKMNPVTTVDENVELHGDYVIHENVTVEQFIKAKDIQSGSQNYGIKRLWNKGLKLVEQQIAVHLKFKQGLHVAELFADKINNHKVDSFIVMGLEKPQVISGWKKFPGNLNIVGFANAENVNGIRLQELESNVLKTVGNQTMNGKHHFDTIIANRVLNIKTHFTDKPWEDVVTISANQKITGTTIITANSVQIDNIETRTLNSLQINGYDFNVLVNDTVLKGDTRQILGHKTFHSLSVKDLEVHTLDLDKIPNLLESAKTTFQIDEDIFLPNNIFVENIIFSNVLNGIPSENFGHPWMLSEAEQIIESDQSFKKLIIYGKLFIESGSINNVNVINLKENSIKVDEPFHFETVTFAKGVASIQGVSLEGNFDSLYLSDIVQSNTHIEQIITGNTRFNSNVVIYGEVHFSGLVSGVNLTDLCRFAFGTDNGPYNLHIKGNAYFAKGPIVHHINTLPIKSILENAWFKDQDVHLTGQMQFDDVIFNNEVTVDGLVDGVQLQELAATYFSKSRDQNITVAYDFDSDVLFKSGVSASAANVEGTVCDINLEEFLRTAILNGYDQVFESTVYLDISEVMDIQGEYLVNNLDLTTDVMRYDIQNIVTGRKVIENVQVSSLLLDHTTKVQSLDLLWWTQNVVLKKGTFSIPGEIVFSNHTEFLQEVTIQGFVNRQIFNRDTIMVKSLPQNVTGYKKISGTTMFDSMKLKGYLNGFELLPFLYNQAYKNQDISFQTPIHLNAEMAASNVVIEKLYQGINVSRLIHNLTRFATIENYQDHYEKLLNKSYEVKRSLTAQAYFLDYYEVKQVFTMVHTVIPVTFENSVDQYLAHIVKEGQEKYSATFYIWNNEKEQFIGADIKGIHIPLRITHIEKILFKGKERWYIEYQITEEPTNSTSMESHIYDVTQNGLIKVSSLKPHSGAKYVATLTLPNERNCIFLLFAYNPTLYCEQKSSGETTLDSYQTFNTNNPIEVSISTISDTVYIFIVNRESALDEATVDIWKYDATTGMFTADQNIYVTNPNSITTEVYKETSYLIIASGRIQNSKHTGLLNIYKQDKNTFQFELSQNIDINVPVKVLLAELPTGELMLYVATDNPAEPIVVFAYEGITGFQQTVVANTVAKTTALTSFNTIDNRHFVLAKNVNETLVIEGVFKGHSH